MKGGGKAKSALSKHTEETNLKKNKQLAAKDDKAKKKQAANKGAKKDPNKPKRPPTAFFVFLEEFRKTFGASHPDNKSVSVVGKAGGDKWKSLSEAEKAPYHAKAAARKADYVKNVKAYDAKQEKAAAEEESEKSAVNDDDDEGSEDDDEDDDE